MTLPNLPLLRYTRVSKTGKRKLLHSHDLQDDAIRSMAERFGLTLTIERVSDTDRTGANFDREGWQRGLQMLRDGLIRGFAVATLDRFARDVAEGFAMLKEIQTLNGELWVDDSGGKIDLDDDASLMNFAMRLVIGHMEYKRKRAGLEKSRRNAILAGRHLAPTFGYDRPETIIRVAGRQARSPMTVNRKDAATVRYAFKLRADRLSWQRIADTLNADPLHALSDGLWTYGRVRSMVRNETYLGIARSGEFVNPGAHEAIVKREEFNAANWEGSGPGSRDSDDTHWFLSGIVRCGSCGYRMRPKTNGSKDQRYYKCKGDHRAGRCSAPVGSVPADAAESHVWETVKAEVIRRLTEPMTGRDVSDTVDEDAAYDRALRLYQYASRAAGEAYAESSDIAEIAEQEKRDAGVALAVARQRRDSARRGKLGTANIPANIDPTDLDSLTPEQRKSLLGDVFPVVFARKARVYREPIAERLELRHDTPSGIPGGIARMVEPRVYFA
jgi:DNA invertase Pin-like site-specific DNA recombinase